MQDDACLGTRYEKTELRIYSARIMREPVRDWPEQCFGGTCCKRGN